MTIKELEQQLGIPRATIRFYEKENLINPERNDNSYRKYGEEDVVTLKKVIILRKIGLSVSDIRKILAGECSLQFLLKIDELEKSGLKFKETLNDVISFEKGVILNEFQLVNEEGKLLYNLKDSIIRVIGSCITCKKNKKAGNRSYLPT